MRVQIVSHQYNLLRLRVVQVNQNPKLLREIHGSATLSNTHPSMTTQRLDRQKQIRCPLASILIVFALGSLRYHRQTTAWRTVEFLAALVHADDRPSRVVRTRIHF
jgi:hypothetical protein